MANSINQMIKSGIIKRTDAGMFISIDHIHVKPGFNKRDDNDERTRLADDDLFNYLMNGGQVPPLEVVARDDGGVWVVEGHRRRRCYARCKEAGKPVDRLHVVPFVGNDVERLARIMTSNNQLALSPVEQAAVVKELAGFNLTTAEIAKLVHKSVPTVEQLMTLATADHAVQQSVKNGEVAVSVAVDRVKQHGDNAAQVLEEDKAVAAAAGLKKVTKRVIAPEISVKKARRLVQLIANATVSDSGVITLPGFDTAEALAIIDEYRSLNKKTEVAA